jgi:hypothetical protein
MTKKILNILAVVILVASCKKAEKFTYGSPDNVYFEFSNAQDRDSSVYTFAYNPTKATDTFWLLVKISGIRVPAGRTFGVQVIDTATTAVANTHYEPLQPTHTMAAGAGLYPLPVVLINKDASLQTRTVALSLQLTATSDLGVALPSLIKAKIIISNKLEKPRWWDMWLDNYSQVKHQLFRLTATTDDLTMEGIDAPRNLYYAGKLAAFMADPFSWVTANPDKGYVLTLRNDGNYDFYNSATPDQKILLRKNTSTGKFYFIDETGKEVI